MNKPTTVTAFNIQTTAMIGEATAKAASLSPTTSSADLPLLDGNQPFQQAHKPTTSSILKPNKRSLGAKKATKVINFDEAEKLAKEEEERRLKEEEEAKKRAEEAKKMASTNLFNARQPGHSGYKNTSNGSVQQVSRPADQVDRLGLGVARLGFGFDASSAPPAMDLNQNNRIKPPSKNPSNNSFNSSTTQPRGFGFGGVPSFGSNSEQAENDGNAVDRFGKAKGISSDQYFGRGDFDEAEK
jgi:ADP-ribosylation factor GTPase-activating protein 2/3